MNISDMMRLIKTNSSKWLREEHSEIGSFGWQTGYSAFSVSVSACATVRKYIESQEEHHKTITFEEELKLLLERHGVPFDPEDLRA